MTVNFPGEMLHETNEKLLIASIEQHELAEVARRAEARLAALINGVNAVICEADVATGEIVFVSDQADSFLGYPHIAWNRRGFWRRVIFPEDRHAVLAFLREAIRRGVYESVFRVTAADGRVIWVRNNAVVVKDAGGVAALLRCVIVDASTQKRVEILQSEALQRELRITEYLQRPLRTEFAEDAFPNLRIAAWYEPALDEAEVGGDFFDVFTVGDTPETRRTVLCIGDVISKGLPAALAAQLKRLAHSYAFENPDPADVLTRLNNFQCHIAAQEDNPDSRTLAGVAVAVVDCERGTVTIAIAGMEPVAILSTIGVVNEVFAQGITVGIQPDEVYENAVVEAVFGDTILMTTDGLTEARQGKQFLGYDGLIVIALKHINAVTITDMGNAIVRKD